MIGEIVTDFPFNPNFIGVDSDPYADPISISSIKNLIPINSSLIFEERTASSSVTGFTQRIDDTSIIDK